jgi:glycosyltransferase involved in cell wall biosynthesis
MLTPSEEIARENPRKPPVILLPGRLSPTTGKLFTPARASRRGGLGAMTSAHRIRRATAAGEPADLRIAVYTDYAYRRDEAGVYAERAFALFVNELAGRVGQLTLLGRVHPGSGRGRYRMDDRLRFVELPFYEALTDPRRSVGRMAASLGRFWRALDDVDAVWLLGPHPLALAFAGLARLRGRRIVLGVRQDTGTYLRTRHPTRRWLWTAGAVLERAWRAVARRTAVIVVGPQLATQYDHPHRTLPVAISLVRADQVGGPREDGGGRDGEIRLLSVGRLETEKNPLLMADVLAGLNRGDQRWSLTVCGEGPLLEPLRDRLAEVGMADHAELLGYVPFDGLERRYRASDLLLHVSWTEGLPQVLFEAFAAGLPVVATDVGGIRAAVGDATVLIPPGDADAAVAAIRALAENQPRRDALVAAGLACASEHTIESETDRVARFLAGVPLTAAAA